MSEPIFPDVTVRLSGAESNAGNLMAIVVDGLKTAGHGGHITLNTFRLEAMSETYEELIQTCMRWVNVE